MNKFVILMQGLLLLAVYGFSQEDSASSIKRQIKIFDSLATLTQKKPSGLETILKMSYTVLNTDP